jgi:hypothetical protein
VSVLSATLDDAGPTDGTITEVSTASRLICSFCPVCADFVVTSSTVISSSLVFSKVRSTSTGSFDDFPFFLEILTILISSSELTSESESEDKQSS